MISINSVLALGYRIDYTEPAGCKGCVLIQDDLKIAFGCGNMVGCYDVVDYNFIIADPNNLGSGPLVKLIKAAMEIENLHA